MKNNKNSKTGKVFLVGAGPGDPGLITLRGVSLLQSAETVVYDALVSPAVLEIAPCAEKIYVGKSKMSVHGTAQEKINRLLVTLARQGKKIVRLKGGDPFIFGRGGEEASYLKKARVPFEIIPGVSAGYAAAAYAGIPVTDRRFASHVTFVTAHETPGKPETAVDWASLAALNGTLVIFMGVQNLEKAAKLLIASGKKASTPVSVIERGTTLGQRVVTGTLGTVAAKAKREKIAAPAVTVIGDVNRLRNELNWFESKPLSGKKVLVTRARTQAGILSVLLQEQGASVIEYPVIEILPPANWNEVDDIIRNMKAFDWVIFTSVNGVESFFNRLKTLKLDARIFFNKKIAAIGEATAESLQGFGIIADLVPEKFTSEALADEFRKLNVRGDRILLARTDIAPATLREELEKMGALVRELTVYRTVSVREKGRKKELEKWVRERKIDFITFTSSSTVRNFFESLPAKLRKQVKAKLISIGPVTTQTLKEFGLRPHREAERHTLAGLVEAVTRS